ncbi:MAG TPA: tRNA (N(6)-L-threonylcarbamoyladenosine(37)-C(2))-methylthiotransferase MtaB [Bacteroidales bacterium]|nr:tRNA (N(6)-L-threonylcarbamoyladenosine(37)-C(2))-methylthiotransferase MtaB [Bacteroidales bacterium]HPK29863.1 tRNA (N(6)-L-threonylcarbamoyladenosine(37)-C(2))-methylthiotransferase MtaB [Bacteroidales bacterium]
MESSPGYTVAFATLGCKLNFAESSAIASSFKEAGYRQVSANSPADIYVVNTCSVTEHSDKKCRNLIRKLHKLSPAALIGVTGCYAQLKPKEVLQIEGVAVLFGNGHKEEVFETLHRMLQERKPDREQKPEEERENYKKLSLISPIEGIKSIFPAYSSGERTRSFLKVQDGCDYHCSYCTVPLARGGSRNIPISTLVSQAESIASSGIVEIVLTGVNTGDFGKSTGESFLELLKQLNRVGGITRYRISSIEPNLLTEEIVEWIASGTKFLPHFHIPIQSGCDAVLKRMRRRYTTDLFASRIEMIRDKMESPEQRFSRVFFGIDVIVGFPGESDEEFDQTYRFLEKIRPAFLHIFPYSRRAGTPAAAMPDQVPENVKRVRVARLKELSDRLNEEFCAANKGRTLPVLFESTRKGGMMLGYTDNYIKVERPYDPALIGRISQVTL